MLTKDDMKLGVVAIGRNEGDRLKRCIASLSTASVSRIVYVDSGSTDGSATWTRDQGADVIDLDLRKPFTAARARNAGLRRLLEVASNIDYVQFVDGDCEIIPGWLQQAANFLDLHQNVGAVSGILHETDPDRSVYNWLCEREWEGPTGEVKACGGIAMMRVASLASVDGFREDLIAGEEPELCVRLRRAGWHIWRLPTAMARHDAEMTRFAQWWKRAVRSGYANALGAQLHGQSPERFRVWELRRAWLWGVFLPIALALVSVALWPWGCVVWLIYAAQFIRQTIRNRGPLRERALLASFQILARFAEGWGQIRFLRDQLLSRRPALIEYKRRS